MRMSLNVEFGWNSFGNHLKTFEMRRSPRPRERSSVFPRFSYARPQTRLFLRGQHSHQRFPSKITCVRKTYGSWSPRGLIGLLSEYFGPRNLVRGSHGKLQAERFRYEFTNQGRKARAINRRSVTLSENERTMVVRDFFISVCLWRLWKHLQI